MIPRQPGAAAGAVRGALARRPSVRAVVEKSDFLQRLVYLLWFVILFDPQWMLAGILKLTPLLKAPLGIMVVLALTMLAKPRKGDWIWGMAAWIFATAINLPFAYNRGAAMIPFKALIVYYVVGLGVMRAIRTPRAAGPLLFMLCAAQYLWWGAWGIKSGLVEWHPNLANFDGYGPLMAIGMGPAYFYGMATPSPGRKKLAFLAAAMCIIGVVSSFARGAVLSLGATVAYIWMRSPNKGKNAGLIVMGGFIVMIAGSLINGSSRGSDTRSNFFEEMSTMFDVSEGSTGSDRKALWAAATQVWLRHPVLGAGADNFGMAAASMFQAGQVGGQYAENPNTLYGRALHSNYYQILSEFGIVGVLIYGFLTIQFFKNCRWLMRPETIAVWRARGGVEDLRNIALGLEGGMVAFMLTGYFYNQLFTSWFYALLFAAILLRQLTTPDGKMPARGGVPQRGARRP
jgi:O-antigen ligase